MYLLIQICTMAKIGLLNPVFHLSSYKENQANILIEFEGLFGVIVSTIAQQVRGYDGFDSRSRSRSNSFVH